MVVRDCEYAAVGFARVIQEPAGTAMVHAIAYVGRLVVGVEPALRFSTLVFDFVITLLDSAFDIAPFFRGHKLLQFLWLCPALGEVIKIHEIVVLSCRAT